MRRRGQQARAAAASAAAGAPRVAVAEAGLVAAAVEVMAAAVLGEERAGALVVARAGALVVARAGALAGESGVGAAVGAAVGRVRVVAGGAVGSVAAEARAVEARAAEALPRQGRGAQQALESCEARCEERAPRQAASQMARRHCIASSGQHFAAPTCNDAINQCRHRTCWRKARQRADAAQPAQGACRRARRKAVGVGTAGGCKQQPPKQASANACRQPGSCCRAPAGPPTTYQGM